MEEFQSSVVLWPESSETQTWGHTECYIPVRAPAYVGAGKSRRWPHTGECWAVIQRSRASWGVCLSPFPMGRPENTLCSTQMRKPARISSCSSRMPQGLLRGQQIGFNTIAYSLVLPASTDKNEKKEKTQGFQTLSHHSFITSSHWLSTSWPLDFQLRFCLSHRETWWHITG